MRKIAHHSDVEIVRVIKQGDKRAFDELYHRYVDKMLGFADSFLGDSVEDGEWVQIRLDGFDRSFDPARDYLWPIPQRERELNTSLTQNSGY